jgi:hypothetical protein
MPQSMKVEYFLLYRKADRFFSNRFLIWVNKVGIPNNSYASSGVSISFGFNYFLFCIPVKKIFWCKNP